MGHDRPLGVMELRIGSLQSPGRLTVGSGTTGVNLPTLRVSLQNELFIRGGLEVGGNPGVLRLSQRDKPEDRRVAGDASVLPATRDANRKLTTS
jgi:hypothetical protein